MPADIEAAIALGRLLEQSEAIDRSVQALMRRVAENRERILELERRIEE